MMALESNPPLKSEEPDIAHLCGVDRVRSNFSPPSPSPEALIAMTGFEVDSPGDRKDWAVETATS